MKKKYRDGSDRPRRKCSKMEHVLGNRRYKIGDRKDKICLQFYGQSSAILPCFTQRFEHYKVLQVLYTKIHTFISRPFS